MTWIPQFHLSTALVMIVMTGVMMALNLRPNATRTLKNEQIFCGRRELIEQVAFPNSFFRGPMTIQYIDHGWPLMWRRDMNWTVESEAHQIKNGSDQSIENDALVIDIGIALFCVISTGFFFERYFAKLYQVKR